MDNPGSDNPSGIHFAHDISESREDQIEKYECDSQKEREPFLDETYQDNDKSDAEHGEKIIGYIFA